MKKENISMSNVGLDHNYNPYIRKHLNDGIRFFHEHRVCLVLGSWPPKQCYKMTPNDILIYIGQCSLIVRHSAIPRLAPLSAIIIEASSCSRWEIIGHSQLDNVQSKRLWSTKS